MSLIGRLVIMAATLTIAAYWPTISSAQSPPPSACSKTALYFINGVTTTLDEARLNAGKLGDGIQEPTRNNPRAKECVP